MWLKTHQPLTLSKQLFCCPHDVLRKLAVQLISQMALTADMKRNSPVTEAAFLNGICCPPQDPFKLSAQELLLKPQKREVMKRDRDHSAKAPSRRHWLLYSVDDFAFELQESTKVGTETICLKCLTIIYHPYIIKVKKIS